MDKIKILIIDDSESFSKLIKLNLELEDGRFSVAAAINGSGGISAAKETSPQLILLDAHLPDMDGFKVLGEIRNTPSTSEIPVIMLSGQDEETMKSESSSANFPYQGHLTKPIENQKLVAKIVEILQI